MKKIILVLLFLSFLSLGTLVSPAFAAGDDRFGIGGGCSAPIELGFHWDYDWGGGSSYPNQEEGFCISSLGINVFFSLGQLGNSKTYDTDPNYNIPKLEQTYLQGNDDKALYSRLNSFLQKYPPNKQAPQSSFLMIPKYVLDHPGMYYAVENEPDWGPYITPEDYAEFYNIFYTRIKKYDPSAKVLIGGLVSIIPEVSARNINWGRYGNSTDRYYWLRQFRESYKSKFGVYPPVDIWNIHPYVFSNNWQWQEAKQRIIDFKDVFLQSIGEQNKPVWISEFGILAQEGQLVKGTTCPTHGCLTSAEQEEEWRMVAEDFMLPLVTWLKDTNYAQKWFWFVAGEEYPWAGLNNVGDIYRNSSGLYNSLGTVYSDLANDRIIINGDFETAGTKPFKYLFWAGGPGTDYTVSIDNSEKHSGNRSARLHIGSQPGSYGAVATIFQAINNSKLSNKTIQISAWTKTKDTGASGLQISLFFNDGTSKSAWYYLPPAPFPQWTKLSSGYIQLPGNLSKILIEGLASGANGTVWFDDVNTVNVNAPTATSTPPTPIPCGVLNDEQAGFESGSQFQTWTNAGSGTWNTMLNSSQSVNGSTSLSAVYTADKTTTVASVFTPVNSAPSSGKEGVFTGSVHISSNSLSSPSTLKACLGHWYNWGKNGQSAYGDDCVNLDMTKLNTWQTFTLHSPSKNAQENMLLAYFIPSGDSGVIRFLVDGLCLNYQNVLTTSPSPTPNFLPGDLNHDGHVNIFDYNLFIPNFGKTGSPGFIPSDIDRNGSVNIFDYNILLGNFGK